MVAADALIIATAAAIASLSIRRLYVIPALAFAGASLVAAFFPDTGPFPALGAGAITVVSFAVLRQRLKAPLLDAFDPGPASGAPEPARGNVPDTSRRDDARPLG